MAVDEQVETDEQRATRLLGEAPIEVEYVVQMAKTFVHEEAGVTAADPLMAWVDIATIKAPLRTKRKTLIGKALTEAGIKPQAGMGAPRVRVLDAPSAAVTEIPVVVREPEFDI